LLNRLRPRIVRDLKNDPTLEVIIVLTVHRIQKPAYAASVARFSACPHKQLDARTNFARRQQRQAIVSGRCGSSQDSLNFS
jgi:hypothetical protein